MERIYLRGLKTKQHSKSYPSLSSKKLGIGGVLAESGQNSSDSIKVDRSKAEQTLQICVHRRNKNHYQQLFTKKHFSASLQMLNNSFGF